MAPEKRCIHMKQLSLATTGFELSPHSAIEYPLLNIITLSIAYIVGLIATVLSKPIGSRQFRIYIRWN